MGTPGTNQIIALVEDVCGLSILGPEALGQHFCRKVRCARKCVGRSTLKKQLSCVPGSKATRCPAGSSSWRQNSAEWLCSGLQHSLDLARPPHHPKATLPCRRNRCRAAPRLRPNHGGFGMRALFIFRRKTSHMLLKLLTYKSHKARCAAAGPASVPA